MYKKFLLVILFLISTISYAAHIQFPSTPSKLNCKLNQVYFKNSAVYFNKTTPSKSPQVFLIKNNSAFPITVNYIKSNAGAGAGWASQISPGNWSAIAVSQKNFNLICQTTVKGKISTVNCTVLQICQPTGGLTINGEGNYWVVEDKSWQELIANLKQRAM